MAERATNRDAYVHLSVADLRFPRQLLLWAMRQTHHGAGDGETQRLIGAALQRVGISPAHRHLNRLVECFATQSFRPVQVLPPDLGWVSCDEMLILDALGVMQQAGIEQLDGCWMQWLSATTCRVAVVHAAELMSVFSGAGLLLGVPCDDLNKMAEQPTAITRH